MNSSSLVAIKITIFSMLVPSPETISAWPKKLREPGQFRRVQEVLTLVANWFGEDRGAFFVCKSRDKQAMRAPGTDSPNAWSFSLLGVVHHWDSSQLSAKVDLLRLVSRIVEQFLTSAVGSM